MKNQSITIAVVALTFLGALAQRVANAQKDLLGPSGPAKDLYAVSPDDDCATAMQALLGKLDANPLRTVGGYSAKQLGDLKAKGDCLYLQVLAGLYTDWKSAAQKKAAEVANQQKESADKDRVFREAEQNVNADIGQRQGHIRDILAAISKSNRIKSSDDTTAAFIKAMLNDLGIPVDKANTGIGGDAIALSVNNMDNNIGHIFSPVANYIVNDIEKRLDDLLAGRAPTAAAAERRAETVNFSGVSIGWVTQAPQPIGGMRVTSSYQFTAGRFITADPNYKGQDTSRDAAEKTLFACMQDPSGEIGVSGQFAVTVAIKGDDGSSTGRLPGGAIWTGHPDSSDWQWKSTTNRPPLGPKPAASPREIFEQFYFQKISHDEFGKKVIYDKQLAVTERVLSEYLNALQKQEATQPMK